MDADLTHVFISKAECFRTLIEKKKTLNNLSKIKASTLHFVLTG